MYVGGQAGAHIDHFAPQSKFPALANCYENLVYACSFCNRAKSNKWVGDDPEVPNDGNKGFVDPCDAEFDNHLGRSEEGRIVALTELGRFLVENLNLRLERHQLLWQLNRAEFVLDELQKLRQQFSEHDHAYMQVLTEIADVLDEYMWYMRALRQQ